MKTDPPTLVGPRVVAVAVAAAAAVAVAVAVAAAAAAAVAIRRVRHWTTSPLRLDHKSTSIIVTSLSPVQKSKRCPPRAPEVSLASGIS